ncbi:hypothetical protein D4764_04G0014880 [Takifugu flavidus]|uniref:Uncharacterized protein n=1 Tax=Takifugu flavidus TaxID=433684 RepID=A0A5C6N943_9TELE|nr:hypothetical protein D4764_04G0014880 [Takifugu flavidus]
MAGEASEIKLEDETWSPDPNENDFARTTASNCPPSEGSEFPLAGGEITVREGFIATPDQLVQEQFTVSVELPEPAVGAEVDCEARSFKSEENAINTPACNTRSPAPGRGGRRRTMRPEDKNCSGCKIHFERHGRSFNRRAVYTFTTPETVHWAFPDATVHEKSFLCETCAQFIRSKCKRKQSGKRCLWLKPVASKQTEMEGRRMNDRRMGKKSKAALLVSKSCYKAAFKLLWSAKGARKPMLDFWSKQLKEEMKALVRQPDNPFHQKVSEQKPLSSFPWRRCLKWAQLKAPLVTTCLTSLFPNISALSKSSHIPLTEEQAQVLLERRTVVALSIPLFTRNIWKNNFLQASLGAELRLQGCSGSALDALNTMGLCQNKDTVRLLLHRLQKSSTSHSCYNTPAIGSPPVRSFGSATTPFITEKLRDKDGLTFMWAPMVFSFRFLSRLRNGGQSANVTPEGHREEPTHCPPTTHFEACMMTKMPRVAEGRPEEFVRYKAKGIIEVQEDHMEVFLLRLCHAGMVQTPREADCIIPTSPQTDDGQQSVKGKEDDLKGDAGSDVEEEEERGDVEDQEEELNSTEEEEEIQDDVDQEDQVLDEDAEMEQTLKETVKRQRKETSKQEARREEEEEPKRRRVVVVRMDLLKGHSESEMGDGTTHDHAMGEKSKAALLVSKSCYKAAFKLLWSAKGARKPMLDFWSKQLKEEMKALVRQPDNPFHQKVSEQKPLSSFPWRRCLKWAQLKAPLVTTCLTSLFPNISALSKSSHSPLTEEQAQVLLERRTVVALSIPLFTRNIWKSNFLQASLGAELRLQGCSGSALDALNTMGLCQNKDTVRLLLHRLQKSATRNPEETTRKLARYLHRTDDGQQSVKGKEDDLKGDAGSDVEEEEERGDVEDQEEELNSTEEEEEIQDDVDQEDQVLDEDAEMEQTLKETVKRQRKETSKQEARREEEEPKRRRVVVVRMDLLKGHSEVGRSDLSAP